MKLILTNFRCYSKKEFDLGEKGLTLISGNSGVGKSTILIAINFVLYGKGNKLIKYGEKSCSVILEFEDLIIERTKKPNRLVLNNNYEDDTAQNIINKKFGNNFNITGYISQNSVNSFILMSPMDKLIFIENIALDNFDINEKKIQCKNLIKERKEELIKINTKLEMSKEILGKIQKPLEVKFPLKTKNREKTIKNEEIRLKNCNTMIIKYQKNIEKLRNELSELKNLENTLNIYNNNLKNINTQIFNLEEKQCEYKLPLDLEEKNKKLELIIKYKEVNNLVLLYNQKKKDIEDIKIKEKEDIFKKIKNIENDIWVEYDKEEVDNELNLNKECLIDMKELDRYVRECKKMKYNDVNVIDREIKNINNNIQQNKSNIDDKQKILNVLIIQKNIYKCPKCSVSLKINKSKLEYIDLNSITVDTNIDINILKDEITLLNQTNEKLINNLTELSILKEKINSLNDKKQKIIDKYEVLCDINDLKENIDVLDKYKLENVNKEHELKLLKDKIEKNIFSNTYNQLLISLNKIEENINLKKNKLCKEYDFDYISDLLREENEEELRTYLNKNNILKITLDNLNNNIQSLKNEKNNIEDNIKLFTNNYKEKFTVIRNRNEIDKNIDFYNNNILEQEKKLKEHRTNLENIEKFIEYEKEFNTWDNLNKDVIKFTELEIEYRDKYSSAQKLLSIILEAESKSVLKIIDNINVHVQFYLDKFFVDEPMNIVLKTYKTIKNDKINKPQINMDIIYKNMECDITMLSGGEISRVVLAFTLALGEMFNIPFLMLDESTASLDQEMTTLVFDKISETFSNKLVIIIAHQIITGVFNKIIYL